MSKIFGLAKQLQFNKHITFTHFLKNDPIIYMWLLPNIKMLSARLNTMHSNETLVKDMKEKTLSSRFTCYFIMILINSKSFQISLKNDITVVDQM